MKYYEVAPLRLVRGVQQTYTYESTARVQIGQLVVVPLGRNQPIGVVTSVVDKPEYPTKEIAQVLDLPPLPAPLVTTAYWLSTYYATHLAVVLQTVLPSGLLKKRRPLRRGSPIEPTRDRTHFLLNRDQSEALKKLRFIHSGTVILHGITGSGKTAIYIEYTRDMLKAGRSVIVLVPEIALTPQLLAEFSAHFGHILITHSHQTEAERHSTWLAALRSTAPTVVIGPRSALFMPLHDIGCIIIDESHEPSYKQEQAPRYSALRTASILAAAHRAVVIQGSATPTISEYYLAKQRKAPVIMLKNPARSSVQTPTIQVIALTDRQSFTQHRFLSDSLIAEMRKTIEAGEQVLVFHNRRGSAATTLCESCGWMALCPHCMIPYTLHADQHILQCHVCGQGGKVPTSCPNCHGTDIIHKGIGTKLIESELHKLFPNASIGRYDGDTATDKTLERQYQDIYDGNVSIIIGTQVVAKGLDLPHLRTIGIVQADAGLSLPDFIAPERTFQLLSQVIGRVGRSDHPTDVIVQTYQPDAAAIKLGIRQDYTTFYQTTISSRQQSHFPPFVYLLKLTCSYKTEAAAVRNAEALAREIRAAAPSMQVLGPTPAFYERRHDTYRWQLLIKSTSRQQLVDICHTLPNTHWQFDLDPQSLL